MIEILHEKACDCRTPESTGPSVAQVMSGVNDCGNLIAGFEYAPRTCAACKLPWRTEVTITAARV